MKISDVIEQAEKDWGVKFTKKGTSYYAPLKRDYFTNKDDEEMYFGKNANNKVIRISDHLFNPRYNQNVAYSYILIDEELFEHDKCSLFEMDDKYEMFSEEYKQVLA